MRNKQFNVVLQKEIFEKLKKQSKKEFRNMSEIVRQLILRYLEEKQDENSKEM
jgi:metal-responsive CopG/Arc/MetJ family transcriptional regulator